jgi:aminopeptidase N
MHRSLRSLTLSLLPAAIAVAFGATAPAFAANGTPTHATKAGTSAKAADLATTQLPRTAIPSHYQVSLVPDAAGAKFDGKVLITLQVTEPTRQITLNAADLAFRSATLAPSDGSGSTAAGVISVDADKQTATISFPTKLPRGSYQLALDYSGSIGTQAAGLFSLDYDTAQGRRRALYTQFENSDARRMIPSWDEPAYKATFSLDVTIPAGQTAVSNMPVEKTSTLPDGRQLVSFAASPKMSTYLLFFGVGDFDRATAMVDGTEVGIITQKGALPQGKFALDASASVLREYNDYFGVRYPLPKLDNIAAPGRSQFFAAMENWGAVFTFEYALLLDPSMSTQYDKEEVFTTLAHEMAHQWFGDLVTMRWWDDLWLNEGFASWMESRTTARLHPEWKTALEAVKVREQAIARDALATTHPVVQKIATVEQANQAFDSITYQKGESVIRMLEAYVGEDAWRDGVRSYMRAHANGNTVSDDLWRQIETAAGKPITAIAHDFTLQPGVPMITVSQEACSAGQTRVTLTQGEFSVSDSNKKPLSWRVPVIAQTVGDGAKAAATARTVVSGGKTSFLVPGCGPVLVNAGQTGYYRTLYSRRNFGDIGASFAKLAPIDQLGLLSDTYALGMNGQQPASDFLDLARATSPDADPQVWGRIAGAFANINELYGSDDARKKKFAAYAISRLAPVMAKVGWSAAADEPEPVAKLREQLIGTLSRLDDPGVIAEARRRYAAQSGDPSAVPAPLRKIIYAVVAEHADAATWDELHAAVQAEKTPLVKSELYDLLASADDPALAKRALELALTDEPGATDSPAMIAHVAVTHPELAFDFALGHLAQVNQRVNITSRSTYFPRLASHGSSEAMIVKLDAYARANLAASSRRDADTAAAGIRNRMKVKAQRLPAIDAWLTRAAS